MSDESRNILFEKFEIISCLKKDAFSAVYLADHIYLGKKIILKTLSKENLTDPSVLLRFQREAKILARLDHPNIIKVLDFGTYENNFYLSFEYFAGRNLRQVLAKRRLSHQEKTAVFIQILKGLDYAHNSRIIHRDIKPENILIGPELQVKIADFGLAQGADETTLTNKSSIVGTPCYMSPEQIKGEVLTSQSDLFSLGIVAYELFSGTNPFIGKDVSTTFTNILKDDDERLFDGLVEVPENIRESIKGLLQHSKSKRPQSAGAVLRNFGVAYQEPARGSSGELKKARLRPALGYAVLFSVLAFAVISMVMALMRAERSGEKAILQEEIQPVSLAAGDSLIATKPNGEVPINTAHAVTAAKGPQPRIDSLMRTLTDASILSDVPGKLFIRCSPWADVYLDARKVATTPLEDSIRLFAGEYELKLRHPEYPAFIRKLVIQPMETLVIQVRLDTLFGYLDCKIYPWGEIYLDDRYYGQTPLPKPICLNPGEHRLSIKNPAFDKIEEFIRIARKDTLRYKLNFEMLVRSTRDETLTKKN
jgi:serine/threonine protein kinase